MDVRVGPQRKLSTEELRLLNCGVGEDSWESLELQGDQTTQSWRTSALNIHWKDRCWSWSSNTLTTWCEEPGGKIRKDPNAGKDWRQEEKGMTEDKMVGWHHWLNGPEFEHALGDGEGQGSLECCSPWGRTELDRTEQLNNNKSRMRFWIQAGYELWSTLPIEARKEVRLKALKWCWLIGAKAYELVHENTLPQWLSWSKCTTWVKDISSYWVGVCRMNLASLAFSQPAYRTSLTLLPKLFLLQSPQHRKWCHHCVVIVQPGTPVSLSRTNHLCPVSSSKIISHHFAFLHL